MTKQEFLDRVSDIKTKIQLSTEAVKKTIEKADKLSEAVEVWKTELHKKIEEKRKGE
jgi:predicted RNase H-related nuclease YkuK (DUF458 family)